MNAYIDTIKTTDAAGEQVLLYPRTKQSAVEGLEETLSDISADVEELQNAINTGASVTSGTLKPWLYSSDEVIIGTRDGKPLYRKSFDFSLSDFNGVAFCTFDTEHDVNYYDHIYISDGSYWAPNSPGDDVVKSFPINYYHADGEYIRANVQHSTTYNWVVVLKSTVAALLEQTNIENAYLHLVLEYTKSTDTEGSGNDLMPYGIYNSKLDDFEARLEALENIDIAEGGAY